MKKTLTMLVAVTAVAALGLTACKDKYQKATTPAECTTAAGTWILASAANIKPVVKAHCAKPEAAAAGTTDTCPANKTKPTCPAATCTWADAVSPATVGTCTKKA